ncbi:hypothetical protein FZC14_07090, partial [Enterococcus faecium]|nr:hypothetical protein [Enterococcus faecium]
KNIVLLTEINGFFDASLLHNYMDVIALIAFCKLIKLYLACINFFKKVSIMSGIIKRNVFSTNFVM